MQTILKSRMRGSVAGDSCEVVCTMSMLSRRRSSHTRPEKMKLIDEITIIYIKMQLPGEFNNLSYFQKVSP
jgi:hypothetical protein